jgi:hypothetical protein
MGPAKDAISTRGAMYRKDKGVALFRWEMIGIGVIVLAIEREEMTDGWKGLLQ